MITSFRQSNIAGTKFRNFTGLFSVFFTLNSTYFSRLDYNALG
jgi:hypothetical protein